MEILMQRSTGVPDHWNWSAARIVCLREARRITRNESDAQDAVQEAMTRAWRHAARCTSPEQPLPWMLAITRREAFRTLADRRVEASAGELTPQPPSPQPCHAESSQRRIDLARALATLTEAERLSRGS